MLARVDWVYFSLVAEGGKNGSYSHVLVDVAWLTCITTAPDSGALESVAVALAW